jgi:CRISPR-associated protein Cas2
MEVTLVGAIEGGIAMMVLVTYDVRTSEPGGAARLRWVAKACRDYGQRVQYSVFEIEVDPAQWTSLRAKLDRLIKPEHDSLRYYVLGSNWHRRVEHVGAKPAVDLGGPLIV